MKGPSRPKPHPPRDILLEDLTTPLLLHSDRGDVGVQKRRRRKAKEVGSSTAHKGGEVEKNGKQRERLCHTLKFSISGCE
jgi:hypothetical protein